MERRQERLVIDPDQDGRDEHGQDSGWFSFHTPPWSLCNFQVMSMKDFDAFVYNLCRTGETYRSACSASPSANTAPRWVVMMTGFMPLSRFLLHLRISASEGEVVT